MTNPVFSLFGTEAQSFGLLDPKLCYMLDGILFIYGVIVTALYLRAKVGSPGLLRVDVGSSTRRIIMGLWHRRLSGSQTLRLCLMSVGKAGDNHAGAAGGRSRWGIHWWQTRQANELSQCTQVHCLGCEAPMASAGKQMAYTGQLRTRR